MIPIFRNRKINSILYVYLPLGKNVKIFPIGIAYLANYIHNLFPQINQHILDLSIIKKRERWNNFKKTLYKMSPDIIAFSWRHVRYFGADLYDEDLRSLMFGAKHDVKSIAFFLFNGFIHWKNYFSSIMDNINFIKWSCANMPNSNILIGGAGFSIFYKDILKKIPERVIGVIGEGEKTLSELIQGIYSGDRIVFRRGNKIYKRYNNNNSNYNFNVEKEILAIDYEYIRKIFPKYFEYKEGAIGVETNRGCSQRCIYCPSTAKNRNEISFRNTSEVIKEILSIKNIFDTDKIWFTDRLIVFNSDFENFAHVLNKIVDEGIKIDWSGYMRSDVFTKELASLIVKSGLSNFIVPVTTGSQEIADRLRLGLDISSIITGCGLLKEAGYKGAVSVELTLGIFEESPEDIGYTVNLYRQIKNIFETEDVRPILNFCSVLPESELEEVLIRNGYFSKDYDSISLKPWVIKKFAYIYPTFYKVIKDAYSYADLQHKNSFELKEELVLDYLKQIKNSI